MSNFVPEGYLTLRDALSQCAEKWKLGDPQSAARPELEMLIGEAWRRLRPKLHAGDLPTCYVNDAGRAVLLRSGISGGPTSAAAWGSSNNDNAHVKGRLLFPGIESFWSAAAFVKEEDLKAFLEGRSMPHAEATADRSTEDKPPVTWGGGSVSKVGRPPAYDWNRIWAIAAWIILNEGMPERPVHLKKRLREVLDEPTPADSIFDERIKAFLDTFRELDLRFSDNSR